MSKLQQTKSAASGPSIKPPDAKQLKLNMATNGKMLVNALYHSAVVSGLATGYTRLGKMVIGGAPPKLDITARDVGMVVVDVALAMANKDMLIK